MLPMQGGFQGNTNLQMLQQRKPDETTGVYNTSPQIANAPQLYPQPALMYATPFFPHPNFLPSIPFSSSSIPI